MRFFTLFLLCMLGMSCSPTRKTEIEYSRHELKKRTFDYFWNVVDSSYQTWDRYPQQTFSSIAATGFGLTAYPLGIENKFITRDEGAQRVLKTLDNLWRMPQGAGTSGTAGYKGFYYHFLTIDQAHRYKQVELSSIDTGLLMAGVLTCMSYFDKDNSVENKIRTLADSLYLRVDWNWMMKPNGIMSMGWHPESGFIDSEWAGYNEAMILLIMAMGSPTHPTPDDTWSKWCRTYDFDTFYGYKSVQFDPLFGHQYSHIWIDFRGIQDSIMEVHHDDYFNNSVQATLANRAYCIANPMQWNGYAENLWGLSACDGPGDDRLMLDGKERQFFSYRARGASSVQVVDDGTITPTAAGGSFPFTPEKSEACLKNIWETYYHEMVGEYGLKDAFNLTYITPEFPNGWFDNDYIGIDQGAILLQIENHETALIWNIMKKNPYIISGLKKAGFKGGWLDQK